ncbi:hypothetical protein LPJ61_000441 [Coemansia biformis]|uniref:P-loop containing nucleoside triphosphate hydrolase protein n=1 Tax=Coemansia biformis TaxID=1286918 RepID=A0A9W7YID1_9FUNG|nr:hypothetical protein LPJ61_000441 [Coemansia biformis]
MSVVDLTVGDDDGESGLHANMAAPEVLEVADDAPGPGLAFRVAGRPPGHRRQRPAPPLSSAAPAVSVAPASSVDETRPDGLHSWGDIVDVSDSSVRASPASDSDGSQVAVVEVDDAPVADGASQHQHQRGLGLPVDDGHSAGVWAPEHDSHMALGGYQAQRRRPAQWPGHGAEAGSLGAGPLSGRTRRPPHVAGLVGPGAPRFDGPLAPAVGGATGAGDQSERMRMIGQLRAVAVISTGSVYYLEGGEAQVPTTLRNRQGSAQVVELHDRRGQLIGTLEQSVTKAIYALQAGGQIKVAGITAGPLRGRFVSPIMLSFYADRQLALQIVRAFEDSGLFLDQSAPEAQGTLRDLDTHSNALTRGMNYVSRHYADQDDGLMTGFGNSDGALPSVFKDLGFVVSRDGPGDPNRDSQYAIPKQRRRAMPLPDSMHLGRFSEKPPEDPKARLADIKSTFVTLLDLPEVSAGPSITTPLHRHQKQALFFMVHRETEGVDVEDPGLVDLNCELQFPKLWLPSIQTTQVAAQEFRHALVDVRCVGQPKSMLGGILADDMGLGKTLAIISLVLQLPPLRRLGARLKFDGPGPGPAGDTSRAIGSGGSGVRTDRRARRKRHAHAAGERQRRRIARAALRRGSDGAHASQCSEDSDSFTDVRAGSGACGSRAAATRAADSSDSEDLTDDPLGKAPKRALGSDSESESRSGRSAKAPRLDPPWRERPGSASGSGGGSASNYVDGEVSEDDRPMTPPPEFDNAPTRKKDECERRFGANYRGRYAGGTLIICPLSTMGNWEEQIGTHVRPRTLRVHAYHGGMRCRNPKRLCRYDVVLTTFNVLQSEYSRETRQLLLDEHDAPELARPGVFDSSSEEESSTKAFQVPESPYVSPLQAVHWHRVVLDEAHSIKERRTLSSIAAYMLHADRRWCLTGTPIQNRLDDLYSLLRFLHATPLDNWRIWLAYIAAPFHENIREMATDGSVEEGNIGANRVQRLMQSICLRRMKQQIDARTRRTIVELPPKFECVRWLDLADGERRLYQMAEDLARSKYNNMSRNGTLLKNYIHILQIILRLRQLCTHPRLWSSDKWREVQVLAADKAIADCAQPPATRPAPTRSTDEPRAKDEGASGAASGGRAPDTLAKRGGRAGPLALASAAEGLVSTSANPGPKPADRWAGSVLAAADLCSAVMSDTSGAVAAADHAAHFGRWTEEARVHGALVKCEFCDNCALPPAQLQRRALFADTDYPGPAVTSCMHIVCRPCQIVLFGATPSNPQEEAALRINPAAAAAAMSECMLCGVMLEQADIVHLPAHHLFGSIAQAGDAATAQGPGGAQCQTQPPATPDEASNDYKELNQLCSEQTTSTKIATLIADIDSIRSRQWITDPAFGVDQQHPSVVARKAALAASPEAREKCVVFSQWTTMLDLVEPLLRERGIRFTRLDGKMQRPQREGNLAKFKHDSGIEVLLLSLRAGGVGLNLVHATHVFLMDAFWNPSVEQQAIDRIHRLGQQCPITVTRYFIRNSIEERIMALQQRKAKIADISLMDSTRRAHAALDPASGDAGDTEEMLAITTGTHSRQQRLDDLSLLLG